MDIFEEEKKHLDETLEIIDEEIEKDKMQIGDLENTSRHLSFEDRKRGTYLHLNSQLDDLDKEIEKLEKARPIPYFGRIDVSFGGSEKQTIYIGRVGISSDKKTIVTDWRAPICSLYYDSEVGKTKYKANGTVFPVNLDLKRQIEIKDSKLIDVLDASLVVNDDLLKPYLSSNADNQMKIIVASIQKEQNEIIRKPSCNIIVQGVAGSGKTSVALHRIAYLVYAMSSSLNSDQFLILGPNDYFLSYISSILPELGTSPVTQETLISFLNDYTNDNFSVVEKKLKNLNKEETKMLKKVEAYKLSLKIKDALEKFFDNYLDNELVTEDFKLDNEVVFSKEDIKDTFFTIDKSTPNFNRANNYYKLRFKENIDSIIDKVTEKYRNQFMSMPFDNPRRREIIDEMNNVIAEIKKNGLKELTKYFKNIDKSIPQIYLSFINNIEKYDSTLTEKEILYLKKYSFLTLNKKNICYEDIPSIMYIYYRLTGKKINYKQIIIDEAQDYGMFNFYVLKKITNDCKFSIYGDLAQSIYSYRSINSWRELNEKVFDNTCDTSYLTKSYRTTIEITENANSVLDELFMPPADPVIRHGSEVLYYDDANNFDFIADTIRNWIDKGYETSAVICKTESEVNKVVKQLNSRGLNVNSLSSNDKEYSGKVFVLTSASAKGLEFDTVIVNDASDNVYSIDSEVDMHLLYVASTRALHEQVILYDKQITPVYEKYIENAKVKTKR